MHSNRKVHCRFIPAMAACAVAAAKAAGGHAFSSPDRRRETVMTFDHDVKLRLDVECQAVAEAVIRERFPGHAILGEEDDTLARAGEAAAVRRVDTDGSGYEWIIDPIDGTVNFSHGLRSWCCSIAVRRGEDVVAAVLAWMS